jgi:hypothetical protein
VCGTVAFVVVTAAGSSLFLRVELGLLSGAVAAVAVMSALLIPLVRRGVSRQVAIPQPAGASVADVR